MNTVLVGSKVSWNLSNLILEHLLSKKKSRRHGPIFTKHQIFFDSRTKTVLQDARLKSGSAFSQGESVAASSDCHRPYAIQNPFQAESKAF